MAAVEEFSGWKLPILAWAFRKAINSWHELWDNLGAENCLGDANCEAASFDWVCIDDTWLTCEDCQDFLPLPQNPGG